MEEQMTMMDNLNQRIDEIITKDEQDDDQQFTRVYISRDFISYRGDRSYLAYICAKNLKFCDRS